MHKIKFLQKFRTKGFMEKVQIINKPDEVTISALETGIFGRIRFPAVSWFISSFEIVPVTVTGVSTYSAVSTNVHSILVGDSVLRD